MTLFGHLKQSFQKLTLSQFLESGSTREREEALVKSEKTEVPTVKKLADDARESAQQMEKKGEELGEQARRLNGGTETDDKGKPLDGKVLLDEKHNKFETAYQEYLTAKQNSDKSPEARQEGQEAVKKLAENEKNYQEEIARQITDAKRNMPDSDRKKVEALGLDKTVKDLHYNEQQLNGNQVKFLSQTFPEAWKEAITNPKLAEQNPNLAKVRDAAIENAFRENGNIPREPNETYQQRLLDNMKKNLGVDLPDDYLTKMGLERYNNENKIGTEVATNTNYDANGTPQSGQVGPASSPGDSSEPHNNFDTGYDGVKGSPTNELLGMLGGSKEAIEANLTTVRFLGKETKLHKCMVPLLQKVEADIKADPEASKYGITDFQGFNWRTKRNGTSLSNHALGIAFDINPDKNMGSFGNGGCDMPKEFVNAFKKNGFVWGGDWKSPYDPMHFEYSNKEKLAAALQGGQALIS